MKIEIETTKTIQNDGVMAVANDISEKTFNDGNRFTVIRFDGTVCRCFRQDGAETILLNGRPNDHIEYKNNYIVAVAANDEAVAVAWPQD